MKKFQITKKKILISAACLIVAGGILFGLNIYWVLRDLSEIPHDEKVAKMVQCMNENRDSIKTLAQGNPIIDSETGISYRAGNGYIQATRGTKIIWKYDDYKMNSDGDFKLNKYDCNAPLVTIDYFYGRGCAIALNAATGDLIDSNVCGI